MIFSIEMANQQMVHHSESNVSCAEGFQVLLPTSPRAINQVQEQVASLLGEFQFTDRDKFSVRLAMEEALVNAIRHGSKANPKQRVRINFSVDTKRVRIEIEDQGEGFCLEDVPSPTAEENLTKNSGRGIHLLQSFMDVAEYSESGRRLLLEKHREHASATACDA